MTRSSCGSISLLFSNLNPKAVLARWILVSCLLPANLLAQAALMNALPDAPSGGEASSPPDQAVSQPPPITVPAGTRLTLVLTSSVNSRKAKNGDQISAQVTSPIVLGDQVAIPAGTFVQGNVQKLSRDGTRAEMLLQSASLVFPNGYIAKAGGPVNVESEDWTAWNNPSAKTKAGMFVAPLAGLGLGLAIGSATDKTTTTNLGLLTVQNTSHAGLVAGAAIGGGIGTAVSIVLLARSHSFYIEEGAPLSMALPQAVTLSQSQINEAARDAATVPAVPVTKPHPPYAAPGSTDHGTCWTPGTPATPPTVIPGTPAIGDSPGTPSTTIPGNPGTPPTPYPCP